MKVFIDQISSGFDINLPDFGVGDFIAKRASLLNNKGKYECILEFMEIGVDTYESLVAHVPGKLNPTHKNILIWRNHHEPYSLQYWSQDQFAQLVTALKEGGYDRIMVRTFFTFDGKIGHGRFLRQENTPHTDKFEWRRADEFLRRHPNFRDEKTHVINWDEPLRPDPIYFIEKGMSAGEWWTRQLVSYMDVLGVNAIRLGDDSYSSNGSVHEYLGTELTIKAHQDLRLRAKVKDIRVLSSLGPYWSFDGWNQRQNIPLRKANEIADWLLIQPLENWTDKYGVMYIHNGEYFNAGSCNISKLVNGVLSPDTTFIGGLDSGDHIENWTPPVKQAIRETFDHYTHLSWYQGNWQQSIQGVYHFWSDHLDAAYYEKQKGLQTFLKNHPVHEPLGAVLLVEECKKPHHYLLGDLCENLPYPVRASASIKDWAQLPSHLPLILFLPRFAGYPSLLDETAMSPEEEQALRALLESGRKVILVGGSRTPYITNVFGIEYNAEENDPSYFEINGVRYDWYDHAALSACEGMAGRPETYFRKDYQRFISVGSNQVIAESIDENVKRLLMSINETDSRIFIGGMPETGAALLSSYIDKCYQTAEIGKGYSVIHYYDLYGNEILGFVRTAAWYEEPISISLPENFNCLFSSASGLKGSEVLLEPQGIMVGKVLKP
ncbi:MAG: hypothetical protein MK193_06595 [Lentisphaeria bacterium]|nr:hypothetical protein [Lentisphaeria bacterium]